MTGSMLEDCIAGLYIVLAMISIFAWENPPLVFEIIVRLLTVLIIIWAWRSFRRWRKAEWRKYE